MKGMPAMQQFGEEEDRVPSNEGEEVEQQVFTVIRQMALNLLQYQSVRIFLLTFCCIILAALIQAGLLGPLIIIVLIGTVVFLARGQAVIDILERWTDAPLSPLLRKLLIGTSLSKLFARSLFSVNSCNEQDANIWRKAYHLANTNKNRRLRSHIVADIIMVLPI
jgi:hypothetical protein